MKTNRQTLFAGLSLAGLSLAACAVVTPIPLVEAREAYTTSSAGLAATLTPTELYDAKKVLDKANAEFAANGDTPTLRDYTYIATRKIELADVKARTELDRQRIAEAGKQGVAMRDNQVKSSQLALANSRAELRDERAANDATQSDLRAAGAAQDVALEHSASQLATSKSQLANAGAQLDQSNQKLDQSNQKLDVSNAKLDQSNAQLTRTAAQLEAEKIAHAAAEAKLAGAMKDLATIAAIKEESRGLVITLSGSVLFASGKYALLETAKTKLDQVAEALKAQDADRRMVVEGHTDSQGSDATNQPLSMNRATSVRDYLVGRGVDAGHITAVGLGSSRPLLDNGNAENRANNRRVEIIVQPARLLAR